MQPPLPPLVNAYSTAVLSPFLPLNVLQYGSSGWHSLAFIRLFNAKRDLRGAVMCHERDAAREACSVAAPDVGEDGCLMKVEVVTK